MGNDEKAHQLAMLYLERHDNAKTAEELANEYFKIYDEIFSAFKKRDDKSSAKTNDAILNGKWGM